jgi:hypothetical protein
MSSEEMRPARLWRLMPVEQRVSAAASFWQDEQAALEQVEAVALIARQIKFRPKSVLSLGVEKKARHLANMAQVSDLLAARLLVAYHLEHQRPMMGAFLDALGIAHQEGLIKDESPQAPDEATLDKGVRRSSPLTRRPTWPASGPCLAGPGHLGRAEGRLELHFEVRSEK